MDIVILLTTMPDRPAGPDGVLPAGERLAEMLVEEGLAACVNVLPPMRSVYRWKGVVERDVERQLVIKTTRDRVDAIRTRVRALHPYELPELLVLPVEGGAEDYLAWIRQGGG